jgi:DNA-binding HxlR family transcriptional regulator
VFTILFIAAAALLFLSQSTILYIGKTAMSTENICPVAAMTRLLGSRWTMQIIHHLRQPHRFCELRALVGEVNPRTFTQRLKMLEGEGLIERHTFPDEPRRVEYELTTKGRELLPILDALAAWSQKWLLRETSAASVLESPN